MRYSLVSGLLLLAVSPFTSLALPVDPNDQPGQWDPSGQYRKGHYGVNGGFIPNEGSAEVGYQNGRWNNGQNYNNGEYNNNWNNGQYRNGQYNNGNGRWQRRWAPGVGIPGEGGRGRGHGRGRGRAGFRHPGSRIGVPGIHARWWPSGNNGLNDEGGWSDANGNWHNNEQSDWNDANGNWHDNNEGGWSDANGNWHNNEQGDWNDANGQWKRALPAAGMPGAGVPGAGAPGVGTPGVGAPAAGVPAAGAPGVGAPGVGAPGVGAPGAGTPGVGAPGVGAQNGAVAGQGLNGGSPTRTTNGAGMPLARRYWGPNDNGNYYDNGRYDNGRYGNGRYDNGRYGNGRYDNGGYDNDWNNDYNDGHHDEIDLPSVVFRRWIPDYDNGNNWNRHCDHRDWNCRNNYNNGYNNGYNWDRCESGNWNDRSGWSCRHDWNRNRATPLPSVVVRNYPGNDYNNGNVNYPSATGAGTNFRSYAKNDHQEHNEHNEHNENDRVAENESNDDQE